MFRTRFAQFAVTVCLVAGASGQVQEAGDAENGKAQFQQRCQICHFDDSADKKIGPGLAGIKDGQLPSGKEATRENVLENLNKGGNGMPPFEQMLSEEEKNDIVAYVLSL